MAVGVGVVGCGYVADFYLATIPLHPEVALRGIYDIRPERALALAHTHRVRRVYGSLVEMLSDEDVSIVVNLTSAAAHPIVTRAALESGRHVYSEKPLALEIEEACELVELAERLGLLLGSAPCGLLGPSATTLWSALDAGLIGEPRLAYAELDDGALRRMPYASWRSASGAPWPYQEEFKLGGTIEHAAYYLTWLTGFFGPAHEIASAAAPVGVWPSGDFGAALLRFESGAIARITCSTLAPRDHSLAVIGDEGVLSVGDCWDHWSEVTLRRARSGGPRRRLDDLDDPVPVPLCEPALKATPYEDTHRMDFGRGVADLATAVRDGEPPRLGARHALHVLELTLTMAHAAPARVTVPSTTFPRVPPPARARGRAA